MPPKSKPVSLGERAGLILPVRRIHNSLKREYGFRVQLAASVALAGAIEFLLWELMDQAITYAQQDKFKYLKPRHLYLGFDENHQLRPVFKEVIIPRCGRYVYVHPNLEAPQKERHYEAVPEVGRRLLQYRELTKGGRTAFRHFTPPKRRTPSPSPARSASRSPSSSPEVARGRYSLAGMDDLLASDDIFSNPNITITRPSPKLGKVTRQVRAINKAKLHEVANRILKGPERAAKIRTRKRKAKEKYFKDLDNLENLSENEKTRRFEERRQKYLLKPMSPLVKQSRLSTQVSPPTPVSSDSIALSPYVTRRAPRPKNIPSNLVYSPYQQPAPSFKVSKEISTTAITTQTPLATVTVSKTTRISPKKKTLSKESRTTALKTVSFEPSKISKKKAPKSTISGTKVTLSKVAKSLAPSQSKVLSILSKGTSSRIPSKIPSKVTFNIPETPKRVQPSRLAKLPKKKAKVNETFTIIPKSKKSKVNETFTIIPKSKKSKVNATFTIIPKSKAGSLRRG